MSIRNEAITEIAMNGINYYIKEASKNPKCTINFPYLNFIITFNPTEWFHYKYRWRTWKLKEINYDYYYLLSLYLDGKETSST